MENINYELYKVFYYVAKTKNITKASEILLISQPAITQTIKKLESELDATLFYRRSRGMELTNLGEELFQNIKNSIECLSNCKRLLVEFDSKEVKTIRIGGGTTLLKHNALIGFKVFKEKYPNIKIEIIRGITSELLNKLRDNILDLVLFNMPVQMDENLDYTIIETTQDIFVANSNFYKDLKGKKISIKELINLPLVLQSDMSSSRKFLNSICKKNKILLNNSYELESYDLVLAFVKAGLGIGFINKNHILKEIETGELFELNIGYQIPTRQIGIAFNKKNANSKYIIEFINAINVNNKE
ncbi:MAG: LysR family transcriptional regulator [Bacilli bacterium]|nr:LysR family transcriptional regulator [Bacilli bacterium]